jgi:triacylglycerol lipase
MVLLAERGEPVGWNARLGSVFAREAVSRALFIVLTPGGWGLYTHRRQAIPGEAHRGIPVLLVPDVAWNRSSLSFLRTYMVRRGWEWVTAVNPARGDLGLADRAQRLATHVDGLLRASGADRVDLVGHGTGGLVAAWYARHLANGKVRRVVTIGSPWRGTKMAVFRSGRLASETTPNSPVLDGLSPADSSVTCVWSPDDPAVIPSESGLAKVGGESVCIEAAGHMEMLVSARVFRAVRAALDQPVQLAEA